MLSLFRRSCTATAARFAKQIELPANRVNHKEEK